MIGYVCLGTNDLERATTFYNALLAPMGGKMLMDFGRGRAWGTAPDKPMVSVIKPFDGAAAQPGNGTMTALLCSSAAQVDSQYKLALELGATDEGPAGPRGPGFHAGYFRDLDGNKLCFCAFG
jgi:catechol 2,3-dioxygenase-like lactoylglutathione lyase family enzyme